MDNARDSNEMVQGGVVRGEIVDKQSRRKKDTDDNVEFESRNRKEWERIRKRSNIVAKGIATNEQTNKQTKGSTKRK